MKNLKKLALGLMVGAMAMGFSAFTSAHNVFAATYFQTTAGHYTTTTPSGATCNLSSPNSCTISFSGNPSVTEFDLPNIPTDGGTVTQSAAKQRSNP